MAQAAQTIGNKLIDRLNEAFLDDSRNELLIASLKKDANALLKADPAEGYTVLGAIECVCGNIDGMIDFHEKAKRLAPLDTFVLSNFASSLAISYLLEEQSDVLHVMIENHIDYANSLRKMAYNKAFTGDYQLASQFSSRFLDEIEGAEPLDVAEMKNIIRVYELIDTKELQKSEVTLYASVMNTILKSAHILPSILNEWISPEENLVRDILVKADEEVVSKLNDELIDELVELEFSDNFLSSFSGSFIPSE
ncbi:hypothetical protein [Methylophaga sp. OBS3]|uniref:hypothetical protein n=1 Tax=Methylophaga sp. OBS3 TaxID=2991934 RepID=UPI00224CB893|nr:hypothetical protein [Methylophaga sp. OBS3]MCX4190827.1 hypothetical protein [Methylophaga sp. OBS3]